MTKKSLSLGILILCSFLFSHTLLPTYAADFEVIPEAKNPNTVGSSVECVAGSTENCKKWTVRDRYNKVTSTNSGNNGYKDDLWAQFATGIFSRDGILDYVVYIVRFISQMALVIGAGMIIYTGYKYASAVFTGKSPSNDMIKDAIIGILIVIFSYAIMRAINAAFL